MLHACAHMACFMQLPYSNFHRCHPMLELYLFCSVHSLVVAPLDCAHSSVGCCVHGPGAQCNEGSRAGVWHCRWVPQASWLGCRAHCTGSCCWRRGSHSTCRAEQSSQAQHLPPASQLGPSCAAAQEVSDTSSCSSSTTSWPAPAGLDNYSIRKPVEQRLYVRTWQGKRSISPSATPDSRGGKPGTRAWCCCSYSRPRCSKPTAENHHLWG
jgi:hypothetical protein